MKEWSIISVHSFPSHMVNILPFVTTITFHLIRFSGFLCITCKKSIILKLDDMPVTFSIVCPAPPCGDIRDRDGRVSWKVHPAALSHEVKWQTSAAWRLQWQDSYLGMNPDHGGTRQLLVSCEAMDWKRHRTTGAPCVRAAPSPTVAPVYTGGLCWAVAVISCYRHGDVVLVLGGG